MKIGFRFRVLLLIPIFNLCCCEQLDLSQWIRNGKQLSSQDGVALGLVSALQKWATSVESDSSSLKSDLSDIKQTNAKLLEQMKIVQAQNINLNNEVTQANERTMNIKSLYQKLEEKFGKVNEENNELKQAFQVVKRNLN